MKMSRSIRLWLALLCQLYGAGRATAAPRYLITDLGTLGGSFSQGFGVNDAGQVAGLAYTGSNLSVRAAQVLSGKFQDLGGLGGDGAFSSAINAGGQQTGTASLSGNAARHAFRSGSGGLEDLKTLGGTDSRGLGINDLGDVAGASGLAGDTAEHAFLARGNVLSDLGTLGGTNSQANDVNSAGQATGYADLADRTFHAVIWQNSQVTDLGVLPGGVYSEGFGISADGTVVGYSTTASGQHHATLWLPGQAARDLGTLGGSYSIGYAVNASGQVAGTASNAAELGRASVWKGDAPTDLNTQILPQLLPNNGWVLTEARGISDSGNITGVGTLSTLDVLSNSLRVEKHAFLLTPDTLPPGIVCPPSIRMTAAGQQPLSLGEPQVSDNLSTTADIVLSDNRPAVFPAGDTTVIRTATDAAGNQATCSQLVSLPPADSSPPDILAQLNPAVPDGLNGWYVGATVSLTWSVTDLQSPGSIARTGCVDSTVNADTAGQAYSCAASSPGGSAAAVTVDIKRDATPPVLAQPAAVAADAAGAQGAAVAYSMPAASDAMSGLAGVACLPASGSVFPLGTTQVACTATDQAGNATNKGFAVSVSDKTAPVLTVPADKSVSAADASGAAVSYEASAADAVDGVVPVDCSPASGERFAVGTSPVTCAATDAAGNQAVAQFKVQVLGPSDQTPPIIVPVISGSQGSNGWYVGPVSLSWTVTDPDSAIGSQGAGCAAVTLSADTAGTTRVCSATSGGGSAAASVDIRIDTAAPKLQCPANVAVSSGQPVNLGSAQASDNLTASPQLGNDAPASYPQGVTTVTWTAQDGAGQQASCAQTVTVTPAAEPAPDALPVALDDLILFRPGRLRVVPAAGVLGNDSGGGLKLSASLLQGVDPATGRLSLARTGGLRFRPVRDIAAASFSYKSASIQGVSPAATVTLRADLAPLAQADDCVLDRANQAVSGQACSLLANGSVLVDVGLNDVDPDAADLLTADRRGGRVVGKSVAIVRGSVQGGAARRRADGRIVARPAGNALSFRYTVADDLGLRSAPQTFTLTLK